jgi:hypothetical protein
MPPILVDTDPLSAKADRNDDWHLTSEDEGGYAAPPSQDVSSRNLSDELDGPDRPKSG